MDENCAGEENGVIEVMNIAGGMPPYNFTLNANPNTTGIFNQLAPGDYQLHISDAAGCSLDTTITIHEGIDLEVELPETIIITENEGGSIEAQVNVPEQSLSSIQWSPPGVLSCDTCLSTNIFTNVPQTLTITVTHLNGCTATAQVDILVVPAPNIFIPNTFSPNDDGINDQFTVFTNDGVLSIREMNIYDRWGEHLFNGKEISPNDPLHGWDGKFHEQKMPAGVYVYSMVVIAADGSERSLTGNITLVR
jgi:gliding motility-associated-like protein